MRLVVEIAIIFAAVVVAYGQNFVPLAAEFEYVLFEFVSLRLIQKYSTWINAFKNCMWISLIWNPVSAKLLNRNYSNYFSGGIKYCP